MEETFLNILLNGGANIAFAAFLYLQNQDLKKRADEREEKQERKEEELRARYDRVISDLQAREDTIRSGLVQEINDLDKKVSTLETKLEHIFKIVDEIKAQLLRGV
jgi:uncharacterized protein HemX